jgi:thiol-disulfide isomerase/thioredoxin
MKRTTLLVGIMLLALFAAACSTVDFGELATLVAGAAEGGNSLGGPLGGAVADLPTPDPELATATPPPSAFSLPTLAPTLTGPLATLTAIAGLIPTQDLSATPYVIALTGRPHFVEFHARWWSTCNAMRPSVRRLEETYDSQIEFDILNVDYLSTRDLAIQYQVQFIPLIVLLDANGNLVERLEGYQTEEQLQAAVERLLSSG